MVIMWFCISDGGIEKGRRTEAGSRWKCAVIRRKLHPPQKTPSISSSLKRTTWRKANEARRCSCATFVGAYSNARSAWKDTTCDFTSTLLFWARAIWTTAPSWPATTASSTMPVRSNHCCIGATSAATCSVASANCSNTWRLIPKRHHRHHYHHRRRRRRRRRRSWPMEPIAVRAAVRLSHCAKHSKGTWRRTAVVVSSKMSSSTSTSTRKKPCCLPLPPCLHYVIITLCLFVLIIITVCAGELGWRSNNGFRLYVNICITFSEFFFFYGQWMETFRNPVQVEWWFARFVGLTRLCWYVGDRCDEKRLRLNEMHLFAR